MTNETLDLQKSKERLEEIADLFKTNRVSINDILSLIEESAKLKSNIMTRVDLISKALEEKIEQEAKD
jgi:2C-methyl-D-erythritol 2,4-cyclodiphosphate synthase